MSNRAHCTYPTFPLRRFVHEMTDGPFGSSLTSSHYSDEGARVIRLGNIGPAHFRNCDAAFIPMDYFRELRRHEVKAGDLLVAGLGDERHPVGRACIAPEYLGPAIVKADCYRVRLDETRLSHRFAAWALGSSTVADQVSASSRGSTRSRINLEVARDIRLPVPPVDEQHRIADFLDAETARIHRLTLLRKEQLRLLGERFKTHVHYKVTGGNRTTKELREIDWLGSVPAAWGAPLLNRISRFIMGTTFPHDHQGNKSGDYPFIKVGDFSNADEIGRLGSAENWITRNVARKLGARIVPTGAVLYARVGAALLLNRRRIAAHPCVIDDNVRAISFSKGDPRYWLNVLSLLDMGQLMNPGPVPSISEGQVSAVRVPAPPLPEQSRIADDLERYQLSQRRVEDSLNTQMTLLAERRQALITAAVTGQIDVSTASGRGIEE